MCEGNDGWDGGVGGGGGVLRKAVARTECSIWQEPTVSLMVTNIELNIKALKGL